MTPQPAVTLDVLLTARLPTPHGYVYRAPGGRLARLRAGLRVGPDALLSPCLAFVVGHPTAGTILIDTGLHPAALADPAADFGFPMRLLFAGLQPEAPAFDVQLRALDVDPAEVTHVVMTHLHVDHTSGMRLLPQATFTCDRREWTATRRRFAAARGYVAGHLPPATRMRLVDFDRDGLPHGPFAKTIDLLGDGAIRLIATPGHTPGHLSVLLAVADRPPVLIAGDAAYTLDGIDRLTLPMITDDDHASRRTLTELRAFRHEHPEALVVPSHDPLAWHALAAPPMGLT
jgi:N-acyl homoserine lactone hydrolase